MDVVIWIGSVIFIGTLVTLPLSFVLRPSTHKQTDDSFIGCKVHKG